MSHNLNFISPLLPLAKEMDWWDFNVARGWSFMTITGLCQPQTNLESISEVGTPIGWVVTPDGMVMMRLIISRRIPQLYVGKGKNIYQVISENAKTDYTVLYSFNSMNHCGLVQNK
jgi:hypothetical protein